MSKFQAALLFVVLLYGSLCIQTSDAATTRGVLGNETLTWYAIKTENYSAEMRSYHYRQLLEKLQQLFALGASQFEYAAAHLARQTAILLGSMFDAATIMDEDAPFLTVGFINIQQELDPLTIADILVASRPAAAVEAAYTVLLWLYPTYETELTVLRNSSIDRIVTANGTGVELGMLLGAKVGQEYVIQRQNDGFLSKINLPGLTGPGAWVPTPPLYRNFTNGGLARAYPFAMSVQSQYRSGPPPDVTSAEYAQSFNEVKNKGRLTGSTRTADEEQSVLFWTVEEPANRWYDVATSLGNDRDMNDLDFLEVFMFIAAAQADAVIASFDAKVFYYTWRPYSAIHLADTDGNPDTAADPTWSSFRNSDVSPEYVSTVAAACAAGGKVLINIFKEDLYINNYAYDFCHPNLPPSNVCNSSVAIQTATRSFNTLSSMVTECGHSRVLGGIHFTHSVNAGFYMGAEVADWIYESEFLLGTPTPSIFDPPTVTDNAPRAETTGLSGEAIGLIILGCIVLAAIIAGVIFIVVRVSKKKSARNQDDDDVDLMKKIPSKKAIIDNDAEL